MSVDMMSGEIVIVIILSTPWFEFLRNSPSRRDSR